MVTHYSRNWWGLAIRGLIAIAFGIAAFVWPGITFAVLVLLFAAFAFWDGIFAAIAAVRHHTLSRNWWLMLFEGLVGIVIGLIAFFLPGIAIGAMVLVIAAWAIITGILEIASAVYLRREIKGEWFLALSGVLSIIFGILVAAFPAAGMVAIAGIFGAYAIVFGLVELILAFRLRGYGEQPAGQATGHAQG